MGLTSSKVKQRYRHQVIDEEGNIIERFRSLKLAREWVIMRSKSLFGQKFEIKRINENE